MINKITSLVLCLLSLSALVSCSGKTDEPQTTAPPEKAATTASPETTAEPATTAEPITTVAAETEFTITGKKYFTLSFDDGIEQDERFIGLLKKYNISCCTFNINTGLLGQKGNLKAALGKSVEHNKITRAQLKGGFYDGFEVAVHTYTHPALTSCSDKEVINQINKDENNINTCVKIAPVGMAYPGGNYYNDHIIELILNNSNIKYARTVTSTYKFDIPTRFMEWNPTVSASDANLMQLAKRFIKATPTDEQVMLFYVWGHTYEFDFYESWDKLEEFLSLMSGHDDIVYVTNAQFYELFKDVIPS